MTKKGGENKHRKWSVDKTYRRVDYQNKSGSTQTTDHDIYLRSSGLEDLELGRCGDVCGAWLLTGGCCTRRRLEAAWHYTGAGVMEWGGGTRMGAGRLGLAATVVDWDEDCDAAWDPPWGWQGSAGPISSWQAHRLENRQTSARLPGSERQPFTGSLSEEPWSRRKPAPGEKSPEFLPTLAGNHLFI